MGEPSIIRKEDMMAGMMGGGSGTAGISDNGTSLIARAEALNHFMKMQPAANQARAATAGITTSPSPTWTRQTPEPTTCFCFGSSAPTPPPAAERPARREYYPDNLSVQPARHPWSPSMEWQILACVDFLERCGLDERNLFAVSAVEDLVREMSVALGVKLPANTDPHVAAGSIKMQIRHANEPLVSKDCLRAYIEKQSTEEKNTPTATYAASHLASAIDSTEQAAGARRAYILARFMRLLGRVSANVEVSKMNAHCLAKCVAPSMLHWDPNASFALLMLGKITAFVMAMIEDARVFDEMLCQRIDDLEHKCQ